MKSVLLVLCCALCLYANVVRSGEANKKPPAPKAPARAELMDYGPFLTASYAQGKGNIAAKGIAVRLNPEGSPLPHGGTSKIPTYICFDPDLMRVSAMWTGEFSDFRGMQFKGGWNIARGPNINAEPHVATKPGPGWAKDGSFADPRNPKEGPLPKDWAQYKGLYLHGNKVIFSYRVGDCEILEMPGVQIDGDSVAFTRTFKLSASSKDLAVVLGEGVNIDEGSPGTGNSKTPAGASFKMEGTRLVLNIPAPKSPVRFKVSVARRSDAKIAALLSGDVEDIEALTKGGPARYPEKLETSGTLGKDDGAYTVDTLTIPEDNPWKAWMRLGGIDFFPDGRAAVCTWSGDVWIVSGITEKLEKLTWKRFATGLFQPLGIKIVDGKIYVLNHGPVVRLHDLNNDGEADFYESFNNDCVVTDNYHEFACDLETDAEGNFYFTKGAPALAGRKDFDPYAPHHGALMKLSKDGSKLEVIATGFREPNGLGISPRGEITVTDNQGNWTPLCPLNLIRKGGFYGMPDPASKAAPPPREPALCWLPYGADNSSGSQVWVTGDKFGPLKDKMLLLSYGKCALFYMLTEREPLGTSESLSGSGTLIQAAAVKLPLVFSSGIMRGRFNPVDGQFYVCGLKGWGTSAGKDGCLQRVRFTGKPAQLPLSYQVTKTGVTIGFASALEKASATDVSNYSAEVFNVVATKEYGSPEFSVADPKKKARDPLTIKSATLSADGKTVSLEISGLQVVTNLVIKFKLSAADGAAVNYEINSTVNKIP